ncbi:MAG: KH domain-containing protein [Verrucomicrobiaceae bacterium]|nr:MAG: KH domain-containing protein [Verrucomicrobiaceae bacterium]
MSFMSSRASKIATSLKQLGEIQVNDWDFMGLLHTDIENLEITQSLKKIGQIQVTDWDFKDVLPAVKKAANQEVDVVDILRRTANYKVMDWDFRHPHSESGQPEKQEPDMALLKEVSGRLTCFLEYVLVNLIEDPDTARIVVTPLRPTGLRFKVVLAKKDLAMLIGRDGQSASAIRGIMKSVARDHGVEIILNMLSHEEEATKLARDASRS